MFFINMLVAPISFNIIKQSTLKTLSFKSANISTDNFERNYQIGEEILNNAITNLKNKSEVVLPKNTAKILEILSENKKDLTVFLDDFYQNAQQKYKFPKSNFKFETWKPLMNKIEAQNYIKGSQTQDYTYYRASHSPEQRKIKGYQLERISPQYAGIFISEYFDTANQYGEHPLALKIRVNNLAPLNGFYGFEDSLLNAIDKKFSDKKIKETLHQIKGLIEYEIGKKLNIEAFYSTHQSFEEDMPETVLSVLNPKNIVIIED